VANDGKEKTSAQSTQSVVVDFGDSSGKGRLTSRVKKTAYKKLREMRRDPTIAMARWVSSASIISSNWSIEATKKAPPGAKEFIDEVMQPLRFHLLRTVVYGETDFGWQPFEKVWMLDDLGRVVPRKVKPLLQDITDILVYEDTGAFAGLANKTKNQAEPSILDVEDCLLYSFEPEAGDFYGNPILEIVESAYDSSLAVEKANQRYDAKMAGAHLIIYYPVGASPFNGQQTDNGIIAKAIAESWKASGYALIPRKMQETIDDLNKGATDAWKIELLTDAGAGKAAFESRQDRLDKLKVRGFGLPERAILEGQYGTKAEAGEHADFAITNFELRHLDITLTTNWHLVNQILRYNYGKQYENTVYIVPASLSDSSLTFMRKIYELIVGTPDLGLLETGQIDIKAIRERLGIPQKLAEEIPSILPAGGLPNEIPNDATAVTV